MIGAFFGVFALLIVLELIKGLSANGTPPVLQRFSWQLDLAYAMWRSIFGIRLILAALLAFLLVRMPAGERSAVLFGGLFCLALWAFIYWLFNFFWVGKYKFLPLESPVFVKAGQNKIDLSVPIIGINKNGVQKAYPAAMLFYHHQMADEIGGHPILVTYCGMCRSGRVYDISSERIKPPFQLVGAITYNAILKDQGTGSWWRQETGEAVKGPLKGTELEDMQTEQMSLEHWLAQHPDSDVLQYDPKFEDKYNFFHKLLNYEASLPGWHNQETPPIILGLKVGGVARAYDLDELKKRRLVHDTIADTDVLLVSSEDGRSAFAYERKINNAPAGFDISGDELVDNATGSKWSIFGDCVSGELEGTKLDRIQIQQKFLRAWVSFQPNTTFYEYEYE